MASFSVACIFAIFIPFLIYSKFALGWGFFFKALWGSSIYTVGIAVFEKVPFELDKIKHIINEHEGSFSTVSTIDEIIS